MSKNIIEILEERGLREALTGEGLREASEQPLRVYCGFDPTAESLHLGNLVGIMVLAWFERCGHQPIALVGGATGMVGDPSGKSQERNLLDEATIEQNIVGITKDLKCVLKDPQIVNNYDWFKKLGFIEFLRDIGKHFRVGPMLAKDSVRSRMESKEGISYTEFSYQLLQAYDFYHLSDKHDVTVQVGGSDQWGNITAGTELIRRLGGKTSYGVTFPLLTRSDGKKFGKTEEGTIWLSADKCSPYEFYQHLYRVADADVIKLMRMLTFMEMEEIRDYESKLAEGALAPNAAQKRLAEELTTLLHGEEGLAEAQVVTASVAPGAVTTLDRATLEEIATHNLSETLPEASVVAQKLLDVLVTSGLQSSKGEARRLIRNGGAYLNNEKISDDTREIGSDDLIDGGFLLLGVGKKKKMVIRVEG